VYPPKSTCRSLSLPGPGGWRKTDEADARHVAQVALFGPGLRHVSAEGQSTVLGDEDSELFESAISRLLTERRDDLGRGRTHVLNQFHAVLLRDLLPGGVATAQGWRVLSGHPTTVIRLVQ
jgi:hypothetical protein